MELSNLKEIHDAVLIDVNENRKQTTLRFLHESTVTLPIGIQFSTDLTKLKGKRISVLNVDNVLYMKKVK